MGARFSFCGFEQLQEFAGLGRDMIGESWLRNKLELGISSQKSSFRGWCEGQASHPGLPGPSAALGFPISCLSAPWLQAALGCFGSDCQPGTVKAWVEGTWCK